MTEIHETSNFDPMGAIEFYQQHLNKVSRSFAFCIAALESPMRRWVSLTYLVCRILDTVEDAPWKKPSQQLNQFGMFDRFLISPHSLDQVIDWNKTFPEGLPEGEVELLSDSRQIFEDIHRSPENIRETIQDMVQSMSAGMQHFSKKKVNGELRLGGLNEVNQYCFFVAGIVGETLAKLLSAVDSKVEVNRNLILDAHHFGLFLQKVNLLKDQLSDEKDGRFLISSRDEVVKSLGNNAEGAIRYVQSLPVEQKGYRLFCSWSLLLGLASFPYIQQSFREQNSLKISREETLHLMVEVESRIDCNEALQELYEDLFSKADLSVQAPQKLSDKAPEWLNSLYKGQLTTSDMAALGMA